MEYTFMLYYLNNSFGGLAIARLHCRSISAKSLWIDPGGAFTLVSYTAFTQYRAPLRGR